MASKCIVTLWVGTFGASFISAIKKSKLLSYESLSGIIFLSKKSSHSDSAIIHTFHSLLNGVSQEFHHDIAKGAIHNHPI